MATLVTRYEAEDGTLYESREDAERHEAAAQIERLINGTDEYELGDGPREAHQIALWIAAHLEELASIHRWPSLAKQTVDEYLGIESETPANLAPIILAPVEEAAA